MSQLRFFIDHCVPMSIARFLGDLGHDVFLLRECIPKDSPDPVVIHTAQEWDDWFPPKCPKTSLHFCAFRKGLTAFFE